MKRFEMYREERKKGLTYQEIADKYGVSRQAIGQACGKANPCQFRLWKDTTCIYPNVRNWLNDNKVSKAEIIRRMGMEVCPNTMARVGAYLRGTAFPKIRNIDKLLSVTGLTYEQFFERDKRSE